MKEREQFKSRIGFLLLSAGCAIGIGNVWRFPYVVGQNGGGIFVFFYLIFLLLIGVPILSMEFSVGRASAKSPVKAYQSLEKPGQKWHLHGYVGLLGNFCLMIYYTTVSGWMLNYFYKFLTGGFTGVKTSQVASVFQNVLSSPSQNVFWMIVVVVIGMLVCSMGLQNGVERITKVMMIGLLGLIVVLAVHGLTLDNAMAGVKFYLYPDFNKIKHIGLLNVIVAAMNQSFFTLSIGIGMNGESYAQNYEYARTSIDMALGRGGDQAVVKDGTKIRYYGGKSQQLEKTTRVKARVKAHAMRELMDTKDKMLIMGHKIGDTDSFGAAIGIWRIATSFNKKARIVINGVNSYVKPMMARFENSSDYPEDLFLTGEEAAEWADSNTMLVVVDVNRPSITEAPELLKQIKTIVVLDHHRQSSEIIDNAVLSYVEPYASSACEMVAEVLQYIGDDGIKIKPAEADAMYAGIVIDTNNFMNQAGVRTFEAAAFLRRNGADVVRVRKLFRDRLEDYRARAEAIQKAEIYHGAFAISVCPSEGLESPTVVGAQAANELLDIVGIKASFILTQMGDTIYFSARSIDEINVQIIMERLGGGGHRTIAGAQLKGATIDEAREKLKDLITDMMEKGEI